MTVKKSIRAFAILALLAACNKGGNKPAPGQPTDPPATTSHFVKGADISWVTEMEAAGKKFYNHSGTATDCFSLLQSLGFNSIRLRVWVKPADGYNNIADVLAKAKRAQALGMRLLIDFHYSDTWADPSHQEKPADWAALSFIELKAALAAHTKEVLQQLKTAGITVQWVQVGNETNDGLLWPDGQASKNMAGYAALISAGYDAVKAVYAAAKVLVHVSDAWNNELFRWNIGGLTDNAAKFDAIGMSVYPSYAPSGWAAANTSVLANMNDMVTRYDKDVMIVEAGMPWDQADDCKAFLTDLIDKTKSVSGNRGLGVLYWEPECYGGWKGYTLGAFDNSGKPTAALDAFKNQPTP
ncbi:MAG: glycosyl hydrolase 53 family protein [Flavihumibacter sp.]